MSDELAYRASEYRSCFFRTVRDSSNALDPSILGPTKVKALPWSPHLKALMCGIKDPECSLHVFSGHESGVVRKIYEMLVDTWRQHIVVTPPAHAVGRAVADCAWDEDAEMEDYQEQNHVLVDCSRFHFPLDRSISRVVTDWVTTRLGRSEDDRKEVAFSLVAEVQFPNPIGLNVNMLPFIMGDKNSLPEPLRCYFPLILQCPVSEDEYGKVVYLTVSEGQVEADSTQRRSGLHVEAAGGIAGVNGKLLAGTESNWGGGVRDSFYMGGDVEGEPDKYNGGLFMASNVNDSCEIWDALVGKGHGIVDYHGSGEHLRPFIGKGTKLKANELAWLTDRTPHEALPQTKSGYRQFFRLVTSNISVWFRQHSTANPKVPIPDHVVVIDDNKFAKATGTGGDANEVTTEKRVSRRSSQGGPAKKPKLRTIIDIQDDSTLKADV